MADRNPTYTERVMKYGSVPGGRQNTLWWDEIRGTCEHEWQPVSMVFESQMLDKNGRVCIRQPDTTSGRVYLVCLRCCSHTYVETGWVGFYLDSPDILEESYLRSQEE